MFVKNALQITAIAAAASHLVRAEPHLSARQQAAPKAGGCTASISSELIFNDEILQSNAIRSALKNVEDQLKTNFTKSPNAFTVAIVHASSPQLPFNFTHGPLRLNETTSSEANAPQVNLDSIFKTNSISKLVTALSVLVIQNASTANDFNWNSRLKDHLSGFHLPQDDWNNGGSEINLDMLATHTSGLPREGVPFIFSLLNGVGAASGGFTDKAWASATPEAVLEYLGKRGLLWAPAQQPAYSNAGFALLGYAVAEYASSLSHSFRDRRAPITWDEWTANHILHPLGMNHSYFGAIPSYLTKDVSVPADASGLNYISGPGYNPAVGLSASTADLALLTHHVLLAKDPLLISRPQRNQWITLQYRITDNAQGVGRGWEVDFLPTSDSNFNPPAGSPKASGPAYEEIYGKVGDGGGQHSSITVLPALGYGIVIQSSTGNTTGYTGPALDPSTLALAIHSILAPAFRAGFAELHAKRVVGTYEARVNTSINAPQPSKSWPVYTATTADAANSSVSISLDASGNLRLHNLTWNGVNALRQIDALSWQPGATDGPRYFDNENGVILNPSAIRKDTWHMAVDPQGKCDWQDFAGYSDENGIALDEVRLTFDGTLWYDPLGAKFQRKTPGNNI